MRTLMVCAQDGGNTKFMTPSSGGSDGDNSSASCVKAPLSTLRAFSERRWATAYGSELSEVPVSKSSNGKESSEMWQSWQSLMTRLRARYTDVGISSLAEASLEPVMR